jgi:type II secretory pathway pseudopilin PulG
VPDRVIDRNIDRIMGFSLIEVLVATSILITVLGGVAHLSIMTARANHLARVSTQSTIFAAAKMEDLLARPWSALQAMTGGTLEDSQNGYSDYVDRTGEVLASSARASHVRRWAITAVTGTVVALEVIAEPWPDEEDGRSGAGSAYVATMRGRVSP